MNFSYAILSGGRSARMGQDKSLLVAEGAPIIERIVDDISDLPHASNSLYICAGEKRYAQLDSKNLHYVDDYLTDYQGPLSAIAAVLKEIQSKPSTDCQWVYVFPTDTLLLPSQTFDLLKRAIEQNPSCDLVYLRGERDHPLHGAYRLEVTEKLLSYLNNGQRAVMQFIQQLNYQTVETPDSWQDCLNFNTRDGFEKALQAYRDVN